MLRDPPFRLVRIRLKIPEWLEREVSQDRDSGRFHTASPTLLQLSTRRVSVLFAQFDLSLLGTFILYGSVHRGIAQLKASIKVFWSLESPIAYVSTSPPTDWRTCRFHPVQTTSPLEIGLVMRQPYDIAGRVFDLNHVMFDSITEILHWRNLRETCQDAIRGSEPNISWIRLSDCILVLL